jgi:hypothetical protein
MYNLKYKYFIIISVIFFMVSCGNKDSKKIIGIWQNQSDWFAIQENNKYATGTGPMVSFKDLDYRLDEKTKEIILYTNTASKSFALSYKFNGKDTLILLNKMPGSIENSFYRTVTIPKNF